MDFFRSIFKKEAPPGQGTDWKWEDHVYGTLYGNCVGDAIGLLTEFMIKSEAKTYYGKHKTVEYDQKVPDMHRERWETGDWTDDTDQMLLIMLSVLDSEGKIDPPDFAARMLKWKNEGFAELGDKGGLGIGATTKATLTHPEFTTNPHKASEEVWEANQRRIAPNGAVMRTSCMGLFQYDDMEKVTNNTLNMCRVTHNDHRCRASCVAVTSAIAMMLQRRPEHIHDNGEYNIPAIVNDSFQLALRCLPDDDGIPDNEAIALLKKHMFAPTLADLDLNETGKIGYTYKCMGAGFWALRQTDFRKALTAIVFEAGDADTNGAVAGALLGCKLGHKRLPESWMTGLKHKDWVQEKFESFISLIKSDRTARGKPDPDKEETPEQSDTTADKAEGDSAEAAASGAELAADSPTKQHSAETKEISAETKETTAETKDTTAKTKDTTAETKETTAETKDTTAETKENTAETKDTIAETKDTTAETKESVVTESNETTPEAAAETAVGDKPVTYI